MLLVVISQGSSGRGGAPHQQWRRILWSCRDTFRVQIGRLLVHTLSPALPLSDRKESLEFVFDPRHLDILKESLSPGLEVSVKEMLHSIQIYHSSICHLTRQFGLCSLTSIEPKMIHITFPFQTLCWVQGEGMSESSVY